VQEDDLDRRLKDALGAQRLPDDRAAAMARRAVPRPRWRWLATAAAVAIAAFGASLLFVPSEAAAESYTVVTRVDRVEVIAQPRRLPREYVVREGEFVRVGDRVYGPGTKIVGGRASAPSKNAMLDGLRHFAAQRWEVAAAAFREDGSPDALFYLVAALSRAGRYEEAARVGERFLAAHPDYAAADLVRYWHAHHLRRLGRDIEARAALEELVAKHPASSLVALAKTQLGNGAADLWARFQKAWDARDWDAGRAALDALIASHPQSPSVTGGHAAFYRLACVGNAGAEARAIALIDDFVREHPSHGGCDYALYFKAVYQKRAGRLEEARATCRHILATYPKSGMAAAVRALLEETP